MTVRAFFDASVLFAATYSRTGSSRGLVRAAIRRDLIVVVGRYILEETERDLAQKAPEALSDFRELLTLIPVEVAEKPTLRELERVATYTHFKDAPVVAAAIKAEVDYPITWDRRHFLLQRKSENFGSFGYA